MKSVLSHLQTHVAAAIASIVPEQSACDPQVRLSGDAKFGDYQCNIAMGLAKRLAAKPREVAQRIADALAASTARIDGLAFADLCETPEIAGPGFINLKIKSSALSRLLGAIPRAPTAAKAVDRLGIEPVGDAERDVVVVDYSSPNVAKQMHVGHLRSTIIGDAISRVLEFAGHEVIRQNHIGDWGTQFGIILEEVYDRGLLPRTLAADAAAGDRLPRDPGELEAIYRAGNAKMSDGAFAERARQSVTRLQSGDASARRAWSWICERSLDGIQQLYERLGVRLRPQDVCGESFYNSLLGNVVEELHAALAPDRKGGVSANRAGWPESQAPLAHGRSPDKAGGSDEDGGGMPTLRAFCRVDQGAMCIFLEKADGSPAFKGPQGDPLPMIVRKSDGAYLYSSTDLAAAAYRINLFDRRPIQFVTRALPDALREMSPYHGRESVTGHGGLGATRILYVVGSPQKLHFEMLFAVIRALGWTWPQGATREVRLEHVAFGSVLGPDRKMLRTRTGENVKLRELLDEAVEKAEALVRQTEADPDKRRGFSENEITRIAEAVGIGAVKYADLSQNRNTDYVFSWEKMLALQGNTAPYLLYAYARICSIYRKGAEARRTEPADAELGLDHPAERALAIRVLQFAETIDSVGENLAPNFLCDYLYDLAGRFMTFYESCPVLQAGDEATLASRLRLCDLTARTLKVGLDLLGITTLERM